MSPFSPYRYTQKFDSPFSFEQLYQPPQQLSDLPRVSPGRNIGIIGGGIAGLTCAWELEAQGQTITLWEASSRLGGRIHTHYFADGTYGELGALRIPANHGCVWHYIQKFSLPTRRFISYNPAGFYYLRDRKTRLDKTEALFSAYHLRPEECSDPGVIYDKFLRELLETLSDREKWELFSPTFTSEKLKEYDCFSLTQYFRDRLSPDAFEFVGHATGMIHYDLVSLLGGLIDFFAWYRAEQYQIVGGMETLIKAFAERLSGTVECNAKVVEIQMSDRGVRIVWERSGDRQVQEFDAVICALPATALKQIAFDPLLPTAQREAIANLGYSNAAKTLFHCTARPWEFEDGIYGGGSFTDLPMEKCWYPSDNARLANKDEDNPQWEARDRELSHQPVSLTAAYRWEKNARHFLNVEAGQRTESTLREIERLHPAIAEYVDDVVHCIWDEEHQPGSGAYAFFAPGEHERYQGVLGQPHPLQTPRIFFAGEHLGINHASIQGAIQTALAAAIDLLATF